MDWQAHLRRILARLGEDAMLRPQSGAAPSPVRGIFASPYAELLAAGGALGIAGAEPRFAAMAADLPAVRRGDLLERAGRSYRIAAVEPADPSGVSVLTLVSLDEG